MRISDWSSDVCSSDLNFAFLLSNSLPLQYQTTHYFMTGVITGDIINSRKVADPSEWLSKLKAVLSAEGPTPKAWEVTRGDSFQVEITLPEDALRKALHIRAQIERACSRERVCQYVEIWGGAVSL